MEDAGGLSQIFHMRSVDGVQWTAPKQLSTSEADLPTRGASIGAHPGPLGADVVWVEPNPDPFGEELLVYGRIPLIAQAAVITTVEDVPEDDQGGWVKVYFDKSDWDTGSLLSKSSTAAGAEIYTVEMDDGSGWTAVNSTVAYGAASYAVLAHTTVDSSTDADGMVSFRVIAGMDEGTFVSDVVMGYSVDDLAPAMPAGLATSVTEQNTVELSWDSPVDEDFDGFRVYRSLEADFDPTGTDPLMLTIETTITDVDVEEGETYYYRVSAVDVHGNESDYSEDVSAHIEIVSVDEGARIPEEFALMQNYPNPFNPTTTITYQLPQAAFVNISIYNVAGQLVETLVDEDKNAGYYSVLWNSTGVSSGLYFYRIQAGEYTETKKSLILK